jgi:hypothetical protein
MDFDRLDGTKTWSTYQKDTFYPEVPIDTPYVYFLVLNQDDGYDSSYSVDEAFFFAPKEAFDYQCAIRKGEKKSKHGSDAHYEDYTVEVREVT